MGDMVEAQLPYFQRIYSIELSQSLYERAVQRFRKDDQVTIIQGDSAEVLQTLVPEIRGEAIFWLDGHYSGGITALGAKVSPILEEITAIFSDNAFDHVLIVDDARLFTGEGGYPTVQEVSDLVARLRPEYRLEIKTDSLRFRNPTSTR